MRLDISQQMKMDQRMVLAPRMIQSMEILQLPLLALQERIEQEMLSNPVLEQEEPADQNAEFSSNENESAGDKDVPDGEQALLIKGDDSNKDDFERLDKVDQDFGDYLSRSSYAQSRPRNDDRDPKLEAMQNTAAPSQSLNEYLHEQWAFIESDPVIKKAGGIIIDFIDEAGYLTVELNSLAERVHEEVTPQQMEKALLLVQTLDPTGVGARNLAECLELQLANCAQDRSLEIELVKKHLKDIEMNRFPIVARRTNRSIAEIKQAIHFISRLDPRPGLQIGTHNATYIVPDIIVEYDQHNDIHTARLTDGRSPILRINNQYANMLKEGKLSSETKDFLRNNVRNARWLIDSIEQRKATLLRVVNLTLTKQREFFDQGQLYLKPLSMVDVAAELGIHVGTVSRAVSGKYMQTPEGIYPLRYFFSGGTETQAGQSLSWDAVKNKLQDIIKNEDKNNPFNDDQLVEQLNNQGLKMARRTIAKYRSILNIPTARKRKEFE